MFQYINSPILKCFILEAICCNKNKKIIIGHASNLDLHDYQTNERRSKIDCTRSCYEMQLFPNDKNVTRLY